MLFHCGVLLKEGIDARSVCSEESGGCSNISMALFQSATDEGVFRVFQVEWEVLECLLTRLVGRIWGLRPSQSDVDRKYR